MYMDASQSPRQARGEVVPSTPALQQLATSGNATCATAQECHAIGAVELGKYRVPRAQRAMAARPWLERALQLDASHPQAQVDLASALVVQGEATKAESLLRRMVKHNDKHAGAMHNLARVLASLGKKAIPSKTIPTLPCA